MKAAVVRIAAQSFAWAALLASPVARATQLEIIHTNDMHSYFDQGDDETRGGYANVKAMIDKLKANATSKGIATLVLDAGDFSEGSDYFITKQGEESWRLIQQVGYDAIAIGNHDWLIGTDQMNAVVADVQPTTPFLSANFIVDPKYTALHQYIFPDTEFTRSGMKIAVVGLSTDDIVYSWRINNGHLASPNDTMKSEIAKLRKSNDLVIALTHLGVDADVDLAKNVSGVDLIVGGHSHTALGEPVYQKTPAGVPVPIVQAGCHGAFVGDLLIDYEPGKPIQVLRYELVPVFKNSAEPRDPVFESQVNATIAEFKEQYDDAYGADWLDEPLAASDTQMQTPSDFPTPWGNYFADAIRESANADIALITSEFYGPNQPVGPITRRMIMSYFPRFFDTTRPLGWNVWTMHAPGWLFQIILEGTVASGSFFDMSGVDYDVDMSSGKPQVKNIRIGGKGLDILKYYTLAVPEGIGMGGQKIAAGFLSLLFWPADTGVPIWTAVENKIKLAPDHTITMSDAVAHHLPKTLNWTPARMDKILQP